jgi:glycolate oxidase FAD binding subunit
MEADEFVDDGISLPTFAAPEKIASFAEAARAIVSAEHVLAASVNDEFVRARPQIVVRPGTEQELASVLKLANDMGLAVIPRGGGTKLAWGNQPRSADVVLFTARLNRIVEHAWADLTVTVEAGCTMRALQDALAQHGQRLALDTLWPDRATVGGVLSTNDSGVLRLRFGALRDLVIGVTLALADGTLAKSGGKVVKNVAGYDLPKLVTGALGTLGVITRAVFRLHPLPKESRTISVAVGDLREAQQVMAAIQDSRLAHSALQLRCGTGVPPVVDVLFEASTLGLAAQVDQVKTLLAGARVTEGGARVWNARQELFDAAGRSEPAGGPACEVLKISLLPAKLAEILERLAQLCGDVTRYNAVVQGTGIGCVAVWGDRDSVYTTHFDFAPDVLSIGGSIATQHRPADSRAVGAWGLPTANGAYKLMHAVKQQFDPRGTLNPGRFVDRI